MRNCRWPGKAQLPSADVAALYRQRKHIELTFRDWKTHLGVRGLRLKADPALRLGRLLLALSCGYIPAVLLGSGEPAPRVRAHCEVLRSQPRHGTQRRLSALSVGIPALSLARFTELVRAGLDRIPAALQRGLPTAGISPGPPPRVSIPPWTPPCSRPRPLPQMEPSRCSSAVALFTSTSPFPRCLSPFDRRLSQRRLLPSEHPSPCSLSARGLTRYSPSSASTAPAVSTRPAAIRSKN